MRMRPASAPPRPRHVVWFNRRDSSNPEGGGSESYMEAVARGLVARGDRVTIVSADYGGVRDERRDGIVFRRRGGKLSVLPRAWWDLVTRRLGPVDVVVDVVNGVPFGSRFATRQPVVALVHHVHREMWPVVYGPLAARVGWWVESQIAPFVYRHSPVVTVSEATRRELVALGVPDDHVTVVHNGVDPPLRTSEGRAARPTVLVLGRLVPHKRVVHVLECASRLRADLPDLEVRVVGDGWWAEQLHADAQRLAVADLVTFTGHVDEARKAEELDRAWVLAIPSLKEGWGLVVMEAATHGVPAVGYREAAGVAESIVDGTTGLVVDDQAGFEQALRRLLVDGPLRERLGAAALARSATFSWTRTSEQFEAVLDVVTRHRPVAPDRRN